VSNAAESNAFKRAIRFVFREMVDYLRRVSRDVFIGAAYRHG